MKSKTSRAALAATERFLVCPRATVHPATYSTRADSLLATIGILPPFETHGVDAPLPTLNRIRVSHSRAASMSPCRITPPWPTLPSRGGVSACSSVSACTPLRHHYSHAPRFTHDVKAHHVPHRRASRPHRRASRPHRRASRPIAAHHVPHRRASRLPSRRISRQELGRLRALEAQQHVPRFRRSAPAGRGAGPGRRRGAGRALSRVQHPPVLLGRPMRTRPAPARPARAVCTARSSRRPRTAADTGLRHAAQRAREAARRGDRRRAGRAPGAARQAVLQPATGCTATAGSASRHGGRSAAGRAGRDGMPRRVRTARGRGMGGGEGGGDLVLEEERAAAEGEAQAVQAPLARRDVHQPLPAHAHAPVRGGTGTALSRRCRGPRVQRVQRAPRPLWRAPSPRPSASPLVGCTLTR